MSRLHGTHGCFAAHRFSQRTQFSVSPPRLVAGNAQRAALAALDRALSVDNQGQAAPWHALDTPLIWQGSEQEASLPGVPPAALPPPWKVMLLSDGSVTRHLQLLTGKAVNVDCLQMAMLGEGAVVSALPPGTECIPGPLLQRQVLLRTADGAATPFVYAASWWNGASVGKYLQDTRQPIWVNLSRGHVELYREIQQVYYGHSHELQALLESPGPFWGRHYTFWHQGQPLTLIFEAFSNRLETYLGPLPSADNGGSTAAPGGGGRGAQPPQHQQSVQMVQ